MRPAFSNIALRFRFDTFAREWESLAIALLGDCTRELRLEGVLLLLQKLLERLGTLPG